MLWGVIAHFSSRVARFAAAIAVGVLPWLTVPVAAAPPAQLAPLSPVQQATGAKAVEAGLNNLLDRYAQNLEPAPLLHAAWVSALESAPEPLRKTEPVEPIGGDRATAWTEFQRRFDRLVANGADPNALSQAANRGMARSLEDCHTRFAPSYDKELASYDGGERYGGIGASALDPVRVDTAAPGPVIVSIVDGGPASVAGLRLGDAVTGVDGVDVSGWVNSRVVELVRGVPGTTVQLRVDRPGVVEPLEIAIERAEIESTLVEARLIHGEDGITGYVQLKGFARSVEPVLPRVFEELHAQGATTWVLDLRNNGGGSVPTFASVASMFIKEGTLGVTTDRNGAETLISTVRTGGASGHKEYARPLAVLVNSLSASASELLAADLQEYGAGRVFGETTAGCFGNSQLFRLPDGSAMWITVRALQSGLARRDVHKLGVTPDEVVPRTRLDLARGDDPQLGAALTWLATSGVAAASGTGN